LKKENGSKPKEKLEVYPDSIERQTEQIPDKKFNKSNKVVAKFERGRNDFPSSDFPLTYSEKCKRCAHILEPDTFIHMNQSSQNDESTTDNKKLCISENFASKEKITMCPQYQCDFHDQSEITQ
jgi:hypothetical protein